MRCTLGWGGGEGKGKGAGVLPGERTHYNPPPLFSFTDLGEAGVVATLSNSSRKSVFKY